MGNIYSVLVGVFKVPLEYLGILLMWQTNVVTFITFTGFYLFCLIGKKEKRKVFESLKLNCVHSFCIIVLLIAVPHPTLSKAFRHHKFPML